MQHNHIKYFFHYFISGNIKPKCPFYPMLADDAESRTIIASVLWHDHFFPKTVMV